MNPSFLVMSKKVISAVITIYLVMTILFLLLHSVPGGDPVLRMYPWATEAQREYIRELWGLNKPLYQQYIIYIKNVFTLDFTVVKDQPYDSLDVLLFYLPYTILLFGTATVLSYIVGIFFGIKLLSEKKVAKLVLGVSIVLYTIPAFVLAVYFRTWFVFNYQIFPPIDTWPEFDPAYTVFDHLLTMKALLPAMILPLIVLVLVGLARPLFLLREHMFLVAEEPFVTTARAKGLPESAVRTKHVARCAFIPLLHDASINVALIISGGILVEWVFNWPGIGSLLFYSLRILDYATISAAIFLLAVMLLVSMALVDVITAYADPRVVL